MGKPSISSQVAELVTREVQDPTENQTENSVGSQLYLLIDDWVGDRTELFVWDLVGIQMHWNTGG